MTQKQSLHPCLAGDDSGAAEALCAANQANIYRSSCRQNCLHSHCIIHLPQYGTDGAVSSPLLQPALKPLGRHLFCTRLAPLPAQNLSPSYISTPHTLPYPSAQHTASVAALRSSASCSSQGISPFTKWRTNFTHN
jgi:hypothetical protein